MIGNRKHSFDYNYFDNIDCEKKAYFLGLLFADGNNICSLYPQNLSIDEIAEIIKEYCTDYDVEINTEESEVIAKWIKERL